MEKNKTGKYFKYAIGEIVLVVIGILIALSINNWNEEIKDKILEQNYLVSLKKELGINIQIAHQSYLFSDFQAKNGELILDCMNNNIRQNPLELAVAIEHTGWGNSINFVSDVWGELYATGNIGIIRNDLIKNKLMELYNDMNFVTKLQEQEWSKYNYGYRRLVGDVLIPSIRLRIRDNLSTTGYNGEVISTPNQNEIINKLKELDGINGYLTDIIGTRYTSNLFMLRQIELMKNISILIEDELK
jgi:hypothetical protein